MMRARLCPCPAAALGQEKTGVPAIDRIVAHPLGKVVAIGSLAAAAARSFPNQFFAPFLASSVAALMLGIVPDVDTAGMRQQPVAQTPASEAPPQSPPGAQPRVG
jgi:hypothetical protein